MLIGACLFSAGLYMVLTKNNAIQVLIGIEFIINAAVINLVAFGKYYSYHNSGKILALFALVLAAAATAVALAIILNVYRRFKTIDPGKIDELKD
jgi:NADH:ubiquinone oxidoreductase subunit K